jgi:hypothetical protein
MLPKTAFGSCCAVCTAQTTEPFAPNGRSIIARRVQRRVKREIETRPGGMPEIPARLCSYGTTAIDPLGPAKIAPPPR